MGCDIHFYVEQKIDNVWQLVSNDKGPPDPFYFKDKDGKEYFTGNSWKQIRHYNLFAALAGVRNNITPIKSPTYCLPDNASEEIKKTYEEWGTDAHTPTFYSLTELLAAKDKEFQHSTFLNVSNYRKFLKNEENLNWLLSINDFRKNIKLINNDKMKRILGLGAMLNEYDYITEVSINLKYSDIKSHLWDKTIPAMQALDSNPDNVRCIMWFDN